MIAPQAHCHTHRSLKEKSPLAALSDLRNLQGAQDEHLLRRIVDTLLGDPEPAKRSPDERVVFARHPLQALGLCGRGLWPLQIGACEQSSVARLHHLLFRRPRPAITKNSPQRGIVRTPNMPQADTRWCR